jgi:RNA polymerase sigma factor (sigma-70 family)
MTAATTNLLRHVRQLVASRPLDRLTDHQLLEGFIARREEAMFAQLVRRHGAMVLSVCRRILGHEQDAEDAFQAAFLILARKAGSIRQSDVGGFLYRVAYHLAVRARANAAKRKDRERREAAMSATEPLADLTWREVRQLVDEELQRLPDAPRSALVLCCLENKTQQEAAHLLGWSKGTLRRRLEQGREMLRQRLLARGLTPMAALTASLFAEGDASAIVPAALADATIRIASRSAPIAPAVAALADAGLAIVSVSKTKVATAILLAATLLGGASLWAGLGLTAHGIAPPAAPAAAPAGDKPTAPPKREATKNVEIHGRVLGIEGKPQAGAKLLLLSSKGKTTPLGVVAKDGRFTVTIPKETMKDWDYWLVAQADGTGIDFLDLYLFKTKKPVELRLVKDNAIRGRVVNTEGKPIRGVRVAVESIEIYRNNSLDTFRDRWMKLWAGGAGTGQEKAIYLGADALFAATTDADGRFVLQGMGAERTIRIRLRGAGIADTSVFVANRAGLDPKPFNQAIFDHVQKGHMNYRWSLLSGPDVSVVAEEEKVIRGVVTDADTGKGQSGMIVRLPRDSDEIIHYPPEAKTDAQGRYEIHGVRKTKRYLLCVDDNKDTGHMPSQVWADDTVAHQPVHADIQVKKGVVITGRIIDGATGEALPGSVMGVVLRGNPFGKDYPRFDEFHGLGQQNSFDRIDGNQAFRIVAIPGPMLLMGKTEGAEKAVYKYIGGDAVKYPQYFTDNGSAYYGYDHMAPLQGIWNKVLELKPGVAEVNHDIVLEREKILAEVRIQDADGRPLTGAWGATDNPKCCVHCLPYWWDRAESSDRSLWGDAGGKPVRIIFYQAERRLTGTLTLKGEEKQPVSVKLGPAAAIKGRLLDAEGKLLADMVVEMRYRDRAAEKLHNIIQHNEEKGPILTDATGAFAYDDVIPDMKFELTFRPSKRGSEREMKADIPAIEVKPGERRDLGAVRVKRAPVKVGEQN